MNYIEELDGLRALAVVAVVAFHYSPPYLPLISSGWMGVELFFAISGYLITTILLRSCHRPAYYSTFYLRRSLRIFPPFYLVFLIAVGVCIAYVPHPSWRLWTIFASYTYSAFIIFPWHCFSDKARYPLLTTMAVGVWWSLSVEEIFYFLWAPLVKWLRPFRLLLVLIAAAVFAPALRCLLHPLGTRINAFFPNRIDSLAYGALIAVLLFRYPRETVTRHFRSLAKWLAPAAAVGYILLATAPDSRLYATFGNSCVDIDCALLVGWCVMYGGTNDRICRLMRRRTLERIGRFSYMIYLIHLPVRIAIGDVVLAALAKYANPSLHFVPALSAVVAQTPTQHFNSPYLTLLVTFVSFAATILLAMLSWHYFESPILALKQRFAPALPEPRHAAAVAAG